MNVLVTGASGFIGRYIIKELVKHRYNVKALTRQSSIKIKDAEVVNGDITKKEQLHSAFENVEAVIHNAALTNDYGKKSKFYKIWGEMITKISLRLADLAGVKTLLEIGAGRGNLTDIMLQQIADNNVSVKLIVTDANPVVLENMGKLKDRYPQVN